MKFHKLASIVFVSSIILLLMSINPSLRNASQIKLEGLECRYNVEAAPNIWYVDDDLNDFPDANFTLIQDAINAASGGDIILVYPGIYDENLMISKTLNLTGINRPEIRGLTGDYVVDIRADNCILTGFRISNGSRGIYVYRCENTTLSNNIIRLEENSDISIYIQDSSNSTVSDSLISSDQYIGLFIFQSNWNTIINCQINDSYEGTLIKASNHTLITQCNVSYNYYGIQIFKHVTATGGIYDVIIENSVFTFNNYTAIKLEPAGSDFVIRTSKFQNNSATKSGGHDIYASYSYETRNLLIENNEFANCSYESIYLHRYVRNVTVRHNKFSRDSSNTFLLTLNGEGAVVYNSTFHGSGLWVSATHSQVYNNSVFGGDLAAGSFSKVYDNHINGGDLSFSFGEYTEVFNNRIIDGKIFIREFNHTYVHDNTLTCTNQTLILNAMIVEKYDSERIRNHTITNNIFDGFKYGIEFNAVQNLTFAYNNVTNVDWYGIEMQGTNYYNEIHDNYIINTTRYGIWITDFGQNNTIYMNHFENNGWGYLQISENNTVYSKKPLRYIYEGSNYTNYLGNYYAGSNNYDSDGDGVNENPQSAGDTNDNYPLNKTISYYLVDMIKPEVEIVEPLDQSALSNSTAIVKWKGDDADSGIHHYEIRIDNGTWINKNITTEHTFVDLEEGEHEIWVRAFDNVGLSDTQIITIIIDLTDPYLIINSPSNGSITNAEDVIVTWTGSDNVSGIDYYAIRLGNDTWINVGDATNHTFYNIEEGYQQIFVIVYDKAHHSTMKNITILIDRTSPVVALLSPVNNSIHNQSSLMVTWDANDPGSGIDYYEIRLNSGVWIYLGSNASYFFKNLEEYENQIYIRTFDKAGNYKEILVVITIDITDPYFEFDPDYSNLSLSVKDVTISWTGYDTVTEIDYYQISVNYSSWINLGPNTNYTITNAEEGSYLIVVECYDIAGNSMAKYLVFTVDRTKPILVLLSPENNSYVGSTNVGIEWLCNDTMSAIDFIAIKIDNQTWIFFDSDLTNYTVIGLEEGSHTFILRVSDAAGNNETIVIMVTIDVTAPTLTITGLENNTYLPKEDLTIHWSSTDEVSGVAYFELKLDAGEWINVGSTTEYTLEDLTEGSHSLTIRVYDLAGNLREVQINFTIDTTNPNIDITEPINGTSLNPGNITISWTASDNYGVAEIKIYINGSLYRSLSGSTNEILITLEPGTYHIKITVVDLAGNSAYDEILIIIKRSAGGIDFSGFLVPTMVIGGAAAGIIVFLKVRKKRP
ncbi:MAG: Ig-like domain-containing protein [Candidatus Njordarchaeum guaymaensis]